MNRSLLTFVLAAATSAGASAHDYYSSNCRPYVVEESCTAPHVNCKAHMLYAPLQSMADNPAKSYWYEVPPHYATGRH